MTTAEEHRAAVRALVAAESSPLRDGTAGTVEELQRLCRAAVRALPAAGAGVSVMTEDGVPAVAAASDATSEALENAQFTLGDGPCIDAFASRRPVLAPDLGAGPSRRWPGYESAAEEHGVRAVFAFPLQVGAARLGVMDVYRRSPGALSPTTLAQALTFAEVAVEMLLDGQAGAIPGAVEPTLERALDSHYAVHQAQGMTMVDLGISLADALARLRAQAFAHNRSLEEVARDVVAGRLRLEPN